MAVVSLGAGLAGLPAFAGPAPTPGAVQDTLRPPPAPLPKPAEPSIVRPEDSPTRPRQAVERTVVVQRFEITGNTLISSAELQAAVAGALDRPLTIDQLYEVADRISALYRAQGYSASSAYLPEQRVDSGTIRIEVIEARVGQVFVENAGIYDEDWIRSRLEGLENGAILRDDVLEREALLLNARPGLKAKLVLEPGLDFGTSNIILSLKETPTEFSLVLDNHGNPSIGEHRATLSAVLNSPTGTGDKLSGSYAYAEDGLLSSLSLAYATPVGGLDGTLTFVAQRSNYEVGGAAFAALGITGDSTNLGIDYATPLSLSRYRSDGIRFALQHTSNENEVASVASRETTAITYAEVTYFYSGIDPVSSESLTFSASLGTNFQSQDVPATDADGLDPEALLARLKLDGAWGYPLSQTWTFSTRGSLQWTPEPLPDTQKFSAGGASALSGYRAGEARGDSGASLSLVLNRVGRIGSTTVVGGLFVDAAVFQREDLVASSIPVPGGTDALQSAGVDLLINPGGSFGIALKWAKPVGSLNPALGDASQFWASLTFQF